MGKVLLAAMTAAVLSMAAPGSSLAATTRVVDAQAGPYTTITDALLAASPGDTVDIHQGHYVEDLWVDKDDITLRGAPGTIVSETGPFVVALMGARATVQGLTIAGGPGGVRVEGDGARLLDDTIMANTDAVTIRGGITTRLDRVFLRATDLFGVALRVANDAPGAQETEVTTSVITGGRQGVGIDATSGAVGDTATVGPIETRLVHVTVAGAAKPLGVAALGHGREPEFRSYNSLTSFGDGDGIYANPAALDFHLREDALGDDSVGYQWPVPTIPGLPRPAVDYDGVPLGDRPAAGAFQFVEHPPTATLLAPQTTVRQSAVTRFAASASDPDPGGRVVSYVWDFGDGTPPAQTSFPLVDHVFTRVGRFPVTVRALDGLLTPTTSAPVAITVTDAVAPALRITAPRDGGKHRQLRRSGKRRVVNVVKLAGRVSDNGGLRDVDVLLQRGRTKHAGFAKIGKDGALSWHSPAKAKLARGRWTLTVWATDRATNTTQAVIHFTVT